MKVYPYEKEKEDDYDVATSVNYGVASFSSWHVHTTYHFLTSM